LSKLAVQEDWHAFRGQVRFALSSAIVFMLACSGGLFALAGCGINLLYGRGQFESEAVLKTLYCLWGYAGSLLPSAGVLFLAPAFYARKKYGIPALSSVLSVVLNLILNALFVFGFGWGAFSIALATSISAWFNCFFLGASLAKEVPMLFSRDLWILLGKTLISVGLACIAAIFSGSGEVLAILQGKDVLFSKQLLKQLTGFILPTSAFCVTFIASAYAMRIGPLFSFIRWKRSI
jgi:putative peptidoglycan lipid II flippase